MYIKLKKFKKIENQWHSLFPPRIIFHQDYSYRIPISSSLRVFRVFLFMLDISHESNKTRNVTKTKRNEEKERERVPLTGIFS